MSTPNINVVLQSILTASNNLVTPSPYIANFDFGNPTLGATSIFVEPYFQALVTGSAVTFPVLPVFFMAVQNLHATAILKVLYAPPSQPSNIINLGPGGVFLIFDPTKTGTGINALQLTGISVTVPAFVAVGA